MQIRRVVTGFTADGEPTVLFDGPAPATVDLPPAVGASAADLWTAQALPLDTVATGDVTTTNPFEMMPPGALFRIIDLEPGDHAALWHRTASVDFNYIAAGRCTVQLGDEGAVVAEVELAAGDTFVHRGPKHAWVNTGTETCRIVCSSVAATLPPGIDPA